MNDNGQAKFISNIRTALRVDGIRVRPDLFCRQPDEESKLILDRISSRSYSSRLQLLEKMTEAAKTLNLNVIPVTTLPEAAREIVKLACEKKPEWGDEKKVVLWASSYRGNEYREILLEHDIAVLFSDQPDAGKTERKRFIKESAGSFIRDYFRRLLYC